MRPLLIATSNSGKFREMSEEFSEVGIEAVSLDEEDLRLERPEAGDNYHENARIKADEGHEKSGLPTLADDSGLEVDALDGAPGIHSDRWAGNDVAPEERNQKLLDKLEGIPAEQRTARFVCNMVLVEDGEERFVSEGTCEGRIAESPRGDHGFGYDPIFEVKEKDWKTFGELAPRVKQWMSHRARALHEMISMMEEVDWNTDQ